MSAEQPLKLVICWHMHQPQYCDLISGTCQLPWSYLQTTKDYVDMAAHLEAVPKARAVVNFTPILPEQLSDYAGQVNGFLLESKPIRDPLLAVSPYAHPIVPLLLDPESAREVMPEIVMPQLSDCSGGEERARWHLKEPPGYLSSEFAQGGGRPLHGGVMRKGQYNS
jgi:alpha-amylase/alpha-mannosidase (GH57 family)